VLAKSGRLPSTRTPNGRIFARAEVERLAAERAAKHAGPPAPVA
jgi:hypothetical protein